MQLFPFQNSKLFGPTAFFAVGAEKLYTGFKNLLDIVSNKEEDQEEDELEQDDFILALKNAFDTKKTNVKVICHEIVRLLLLAVGLIIFYFVFFKGNNVFQPKVNCN